MQAHTCTCPFERLSQRSGPWGRSECSSSILSLRGGSSIVAPTERVSMTAYKTQLIFTDQRKTQTIVNHHSNKYVAKCMWTQTSWISSGTDASISLKSRLRSGLACRPKILVATPPASARAKWLDKSRRHSFKKLWCSLLTQNKFVQEDTLLIFNNLQDGLENQLKLNLN